MLILARHHESEWNKLGKWTGSQNPHLTPYGLERSGAMGKLLRGVAIDQAFVSEQARAHETLEAMLASAGAGAVPREQSGALNERDYGDFTGKNKWEMAQLLGEEEFQKVRRGWDYPIPHGESIRMVHDRAVPFFLQRILPLVRAGKSVLVVAHGNSLRTIVKHIESISDAGIADVVFPFGAVVTYDLDDEGRMLSKETAQVQSDVPA